MPALGARRAAALGSRCPCSRAAGCVPLLSEHVTARLVLSASAILCGIALTHSGRDYGGSTVSPYERYRSTACAAWRPSRIAQTTSDWPRDMSPAAKTPGTLVILALVGPDVAAVVELHAELLRAAASRGRRSRARAAPGRPG